LENLVEEHNDLIELNLIEETLFVRGVAKRSKSVGKLQKFGIILILFLVRVNLTTNYEQNAKHVVLHTLLQVHMELET
jgi:hypothetical protein